MASSLNDFSALSPRQRELIALIGGDKLSIVINTLDSMESEGYDQLASVFHQIKDNTSLITGKISVKADKETKSRLFGILDY